jgi:diguanylate cyclase (GGDEF)-like protein
MDAGQGEGGALDIDETSRAPAQQIDALRRENEALRRRIAQLETAEPDYDRLTGLVRRDVLVDRLGHCLLRGARTSEHVAVLYCDLDGFKLVNDVFGHESGDAVLAEVAARLKHLVRPYDTVARFGGDEFVILLENIQDSDDAVAIAQRVVDAISNTFALRDAQAIIGISVGVALSAPGDTTSEALVSRADAAMYEAKHAGKGRVELFGADLDLRLTDRRELGNDLRVAVELGQLELWYRPVVSLDTGCIVSLEGSVRWNHPTRGLLQPDAFVPIAHATGIIESIDEWVLTTAATDLTSWRRDHPDLVAWITVSARMLRRDRGASGILSILAAAGADARSVGIEVAEESVMHDFAETVTALRELHDGNVCVALDNFCGQLTVAQLQRVRPETVKLDRSFLTQLGADIESARAIRSITGMIRPLGVTVVAKGVNTREQLAAVVSLNCDAAQGTIAGPPARAADLEFKRCVFDADDSAVPSDQGAFATRR